MKTHGALTIGVADLLRRPGNHRNEHLEVVIGGLEVSGSRVPDGAATVTFAQPEITGAMVSRTVTV